jgi:hypothetical protein
MGVVVPTIGAISSPAESKTLALNPSAVGVPVFPMNSLQQYQVGTAVIQVWKSFIPSSTNCVNRMPNPPLKSDPTCTAWFPLSLSVFHNFVQHSVAGWAA